MALTTRQIFVLVKAYPQPSQTYGETVCCAGVTPDGEFVRMYPIRYRHLKPEQRFDRYDLVEVRGERPRDDHRPESFHVSEESIKIVQPARGTDPGSKAKVWLPLVSNSLDHLKQANDTESVSLGIVKPEPESVRFTWQKAAESDEQDQAIAKSLLQQQSLIEGSLKPLQSPEYAFTYQYESGTRKSKGKIHDWEVQAAYRNYRVKYGDQALRMMKRQWQDEMVDQNLHLFLGTMKAHPKQFIIVGVLRFSGSTQSSLLG